MSQLNCYAVVVPGLEKLAVAELRELGALQPESGEGGVSFEATMDTLFRINLRSRIATRILVRLASFTAMSFPELYNKSRKPDWARYIDGDTRIEVRATCHSSKLIHSGRVVQAVSDAVSDKLGHGIEQGMLAQQLFVRIENNRVTLSIDASGERLDRRGYRLHSGMAPLRETIAAALLRWMAWDTETPLLLPMCGSATFAIEAAWIAAHRASGLDHDFACQHWPCVKQKRWQRAVEKATAMRRTATPGIMASDIDTQILGQAHANAEAAGVASMIEFAQCDVLDIKPPTAAGQSGIIICNPPYGDRIKGDVGSVYAALGRLMQTRFRGWRMALIVPDRACEKAVACPVRRRLKFRHGGNWVSVIEI